MRSRSIQPLRSDQNDHKSQLIIQQDNDLPKNKEQIEIKPLPRRLSQMTQLQVDLLDEDDICKYHKPGPLKLDTERQI